MKVLRRFDPDVVIGVGGYSSGPVLLVAWLMRKPTAIQEQNALPGFTNRTLGHFVDAVFTAFPQAGRAFAPRKTHLLGNPIRRAFLDNYLHTKPAILVPFPFAADDHQTVNAQSLVEAGAALLMPEKDLTAQKLADAVRGLEGDRSRLQRMARASGVLGRPEAAREIADVCVSLCRDRLVREGRHLPPAPR